MAKPVCTMGSLSAGACGCRPLTAIGPGSPTVLVNGRPVMNVGKFWGFHGGLRCNHPEYTATGNPTVLVNGSPIVTVGCVMSGGDIPCTGSPNVLA